MAIVKHIAIKNANYNDAFDYLTMQHDEFTMRPILDENGNHLPREEYLLDGINCDPFTFGAECTSVNASFNKNTSFGEIKAHHYIISFDPKDRDENGLTMEKAQAIGTAFAKKNFPGHQTLICTHPDGHSSSGNIHVHIVINSIRKYDCDRRDFMERATDAKAGFKHHVTRSFLRYLKQDVMNLCQENSLYQVDLNSPAKVRITDKEYWLKKRGQQALDKENAAKISAGIPVSKTTYETEKDILRRAITDTISDSNSFSDFTKKLLSRYGIAVHESRGRISFQSPDRNRPIRGRQLGSNFEKEYILSCIISKDSKVHSDIRFVKDLSENIKAKENAYYSQKVKVGNLKEMAKALAFVQENNIASLSELDQLFASVSADYDTTLSSLKDVEDKLKSVNERIRYTGQYLANKAIFKEYMNSKNKDKFREEHRSELALYETARKELRKAYGDQKFATMKTLKSEKENLTLKKNELYEEYSILKARKRQLSAVRHNVYMALDKEEKKVEKTKQKSI